MVYKYKRVEKAGVRAEEAVNKGTSVLNKSR